MTGALVLAVAIGAIGGGVWSAHTLADAAEPVPTGEPSPTLVTVSEETIERTFDLGVTAIRTSRTIATNHLTGVVTSVTAGRLSTGDGLYSVGRDTAYVAEGSVPFYRDLSRGQSGEDVEQLQEFLAELGYDTAVDGKFGRETEGAVRAWQYDVGVARTGTVILGTLIAVPTLPSEVSVDSDSIAPGLSLVGGEAAVSVLTDSPVFKLSLSASQAAIIPSDVRVEVYYEDYVWEATAAESETTDDGGVEFTLEIPSGEPLCGDDCSQLPVAETLPLRATVIVLPQTTGPALPLSAVRTSDSGETYVVDSAYSDVPIRVVASSAGIAVVDGIAIGTEVLVGDGTASVASSTSTATP